MRGAATHLGVRYKLARGGITTDHQQSPLHLVHHPITACHYATVNEPVQVTISVPVSVKHCSVYRFAAH